MHHHSRRLFIYLTARIDDAVLGLHLPLGAAVLATLEGISTRGVEGEVVTLPYSGPDAGAARGAALGIVTPGSGTWKEEECSFTSSWTQDSNGSFSPASNWHCFQSFGIILIDIYM